MEQLKKAFHTSGKNGFAAAYPIISLDGLRKYHLVFVCDHFKAATLASNVVNGVEEDFQREKEEYRENVFGQPSLFPMEITQKQVFDKKVSDLKQGILRLPKNKPLKREELHYELLIQDKRLFGKIGKSHLTQALDELLKAISPRITSTGTAGNEESVFTLLE